MPVPRLSRRHAADGTTTRVLRAARLGIWGTLTLWIAVIILHEINIGGQWDPIAPATWITIALWLLCFAVAYEASLHLSWRQSARRGPEPEPPAAWTNRWALMLALAAAGGAALVIYDFAILRQYGFTTSAAAIRLQETIELWQGGKSISLMSGVGRMILPAMIPAYSIAIIGRKQLRWETKVVLAVAAAVILFEQVFFEGGRFLLTMLVGTIFLSYFLFGRANKAGRRGINVPLVLGIAAATPILLSFFAYVFVSRILDRNDFFWLAYLGTARSLPLNVDYGSASMFEGVFGPIWFSLCMLWIYVTHGLNQLDLLLSLRYLDHAYGGVQFQQFSQFISFVTGIDVRYDIVANVPTAGTYSTFLGDNYLDFGRIGTIASGGVLGMITAHSMLSYVRGRITMFSLPAPILLVVCLFTPVISLVVNLWPAMVWAAIAGHSARRWRERPRRESTAAARRVRIA